MRWTLWVRETGAWKADGEAVWYQRRRFEVPAVIAASFHQELQIESGTGILSLLVPFFPKFVDDGAAAVNELRKAGTRCLDAGIKLCGILRKVTGATKPDRRGERGNKPLKSLRGECRKCSAYLW
jgi:hypothetical protein